MEKSKGSSNAKNIRKRKRRKIAESDNAKAKRPKSTEKKEKLGLVVSIPKTADDCGANWKVLCKTLNSEKPQKSLNSTKNKTEFRRQKEKKLTGNSKGKKPFKRKERDASKAEDKNLEIWFDDVDPEDIKSAEQESLRSTSQDNKCTTDESLIKRNAFDGLTKAIGMDCEMVGVGSKGSQSVLARVSLVNQFGKCIYDKHVKPMEYVTDYRTFVSGIRPSDLKGAEEFSTVQREVAEILKGRMLVGHALWNDLKVMYLDHPKKQIRDTADYVPFKALNKGRTPSLRMLSQTVLGIQVQKGEHSSVQDAQAAMKLYMMHKKQWERELKSNRNAKNDASNRKK